MMIEKVPVLSMIFMGATMLFALAFPVALFFWYRRIRKADILPFFIGCAVFMLFALVLESLLNNLILVKLPVGEKIRGNIWIYALFGGLMAGLFEESGRFIAMKTVLRRFHKKEQNALMYGAGHGGFEVLVVAGSNALNNLIYSVLLNIGREDLLLGQLPESMRAEYLPQLERAFDQLRHLPSGMFLLAPLERISAVIFHIAASVLVWQAAKSGKKFIFFPLAILLHLVMDAGAVFLSNAGMNSWLLEGVLLGFALLTALFSFAVYRRNQTPDPEPLPDRETIGGE